jgi:hypothetical protein
MDDLSEAAKNLSVDLSDTYLEQERVNLGINKSVSSMNQAEKAQLRYHAMMTQLTTVQGAMARELDSPINQLRILRSQLEQASQAFGNLFIPILNKVLPPLIAVASALRRRNGLQECPRGLGSEREAARRPLFLRLLRPSVPPIRTRALECEVRPG